MPSAASRLMPLVMRLRGAKRRFATVEGMRRSVRRQERRPARSAPPRGLRRSVAVTRTTVAGWPVYRVTPPDSSPAHRVLYLHGGAYVYEIARQHWQLIAELAISADAEIVVPIYPLAPVSTAGVIVPAATDLAAALVAEVGGEATAVMGDSAGGGMALAVGMELRARGVAAPRLVLISPWLDVSGTDPQLAVIQPRDPWLAVPGSREAGRIYRGDLPVDHPMVSPIHGDLEGLGPITMFSGTRDILNADARRLMREVQAIGGRISFDGAVPAASSTGAVAGVTLDYHEAPEMIHVYPLLPIPEARVARRAIRDAMLRPAAPDLAR